jgi:lactoylglutathione lyase
MDLCEKNINGHAMIEMKTKFTYTGIRVKDLKQSVEFYTQVLGMKEMGRSKIEQNKGQAVSLVTDEGGPVLELNHYDKGSPFDAEYVAGEGMDHLAFQVDDLDKALAEAERAGYPLALEMKTATSRWAYIKDPNGIFIELFS